MHLACRTLLGEYVVLSSSSVAFSANSDSRWFATMSGMLSLVASTSSPLFHVRRNSLHRATRSASNEIRLLACK